MVALHGCHHRWAHKHLLEPNISDQGWAGCVCGESGRNLIKTYAMTMKEEKTRLKMFADAIKNSNYSLESNLHGMPLIWWRAKQHGIIDFYQVNKASDAINFSSRKPSTTEWVPLLCKCINIECNDLAQSGGGHWYTVTSGNFSDWFTLEFQSGGQICIQKSIPDSSLLWRLYNINKLIKKMSGNEKL